MSIKSESKEKYTVVTRLANKNGSIAVLISPGYGSGWYTCNTEYPECVYDVDIASLVLYRMGIQDKLRYSETDERGELELEIILEQLNKHIIQVAKSKWGEGFYTGGADQLVVEWIGEGQNLHIRNYDGSESLD